MLGTSTAGKAKMYTVLYSDAKALQWLSSLWKSKFVLRSFKSLTNFADTDKITFIYIPCFKHVTRKLAVKFVK